jgi:hypothetical protein
MPLNADDIALAGVLGGFNHAVSRRGRRDREPRGNARDRLVMPRVHRMRARSDRLPQNSAGFHYNVMNPLRRIRGAPLMTGRVSQVLRQRSTERDIQHLKTAAYRQNRYVSSQRGLYEAILPFVAIPIGLIRLGKAFLSISDGIHVSPAGEYKALKTIERLRIPHRLESDGAKRKLIRRDFAYIAKTESNARGSLLRHYLYYAFASATCGRGVRLE